MTAVKISALCKRFGEVTAVAPLDLSIPQGELFGLLGVNGAGKTTLLRMLSGLTRPSGGDAWVMGHSVVHEPEKAKACIGISTQETAVAPNLTVAENLRFIAGLYGIDRRSVKQATQACLEDFCLEPVAGARAKTLSGGWQRRLSIAMAMIARPQVLFLDEPTLGLDVLARRDLWRVIEALKGKTTLVLTTHYLEEAQALCDRLAVMASGRILALGDCAALCRQTGTERLEDAFVALAQEGVA